MDTLNRLQLVISLLAESIDNAIAVLDVYDDEQLDADFDTSLVHVINAVHLLQQLQTAEISKLVQMTRHTEN